MMTRTTLKALWVGGGGILATWLAVSPNHAVPTTAQQTTAVRRPAASKEPTADDLNARTTRLRERSAAGTLRPSIRTPFRYSAPKADPRRMAPAHAVEPAIVAPLPTPPPPVLKLSGIAQKAGKRTAIIAGEGQIYLVGEGDVVGGRYTVVKIDPEAVLLRDAAGVEQRLVLPQ
jgi:type II secretory pathway component PulC